MKTSLSRLAPDDRPAARTWRVAGVIHIAGAEYGPADEPSA